VIDIAHPWAYAHGACAFSNPHNQLCSTGPIIQIPRGTESSRRASAGWPYVWHAPRLPRPQQRPAACPLFAPMRPPDEGESPAYGP